MDLMDLDIPAPAAGFGARRPPKAARSAVPDRRPAAAGNPASRRPYRRPRLESLGQLSQVTRFGGSDIVDSGSGLGQSL